MGMLKNGRIDATRCLNCFGLRRVYREEITFIVGEQRVPITAVKMAMQLNSTKLCEIIEAGGNVIEAQILQDDCPVIFQLFVDYICRAGRVNLNFKKALKLCLIGSKYQINEVIQAMLVYMRENLEDLDYRFGLDYYECVKKLSRDRRIVAKALRFCQRHIEELINWNRHLNVEIDTLLDLYRLKYLNISSEMTLIKGLVRYIAANRGVKQSDINKALSYVRFLTLSTYRLEESSITQLLSQESIEQIRRYKLEIGNEFPSNFSKSFKRRSNFMSNSMYLRTTFEAKNISLQKQMLYSVKVTSLKTSKILGVVIALPTHQVLPKLDFVMAVYHKTRPVLYGRFCLKNVDERPRKCFFIKSYMFRAGTTLEISVVLQHRASVRGLYTGRYTYPKNMVFHNDNLYPDMADNLPIHAFLKGFILIDEDEA